MYLVRFHVKVNFLPVPSTYCVVVCFYGNHARPDLEIIEIEIGESSIDPEFQSESYLAYLNEIIGDLESKLETLDSHDTWFDPAKPDAIADAPCYCGWLGLDQPPPDLAPPHCSCVSNVEPNHGFDLGHIKFEEKKQEEENNGMG